MSIVIVLTVLMAGGTYWAGESNSIGLIQHKRIYHCSTEDDNGRGEIID